MLNSLLKRGGWEGQEPFPEYSPPWVAAGRNRFNFLAHYFLTWGVVVAVDRLFCQSIGRMNGAFEVVVTGEKLAVGAGNPVHLL